MISILIKTYMLILLSLAVGAILIATVGFYLIFRLSKKNQPVKQSEMAPIECVSNAENSAKMQPITITSHDINAISGDDKIATQLDLARAYIETGRQQLAKKILLHVAKQGSRAQKSEAQQWLNNL